MGKASRRKREREPRVKEGSVAPQNGWPRHTAEWAAFASGVAGVAVGLVPAAETIKIIASELCFLLMGGILVLLSWRKRAGSDHEKRIRLLQRIGAVVLTATLLSLPLFFPSRAKYSAIQVVQFSSQPGDYSEILRLDNAAILEPGGEATLDSIEMILPASPPLMVDAPSADRDYRVGRKHVARVGGPGISVSGLRTSDVAGAFVFHRFNAQTTVVDAGQRRFRVSLMSIRDKSRGTHKLIEYTFSISEL